MNNTNKFPFFSIIMVTYNQEKTIEESILSIINQTYLKYEIIIIDGNSTDNTKKIILSYKDKIHKIIFESDKGMYHARNKGIFLANGDYIGFINSDDIFYSNALNEIANCIIKDNFPDMVFGYTIGIDKYGGIMEKTVLGTEVKIFDYFKKMRTIPDQSTFYNKKALEYIGIYDTSLRFGADTDLKCRFIARKMRISILPEIIAAWRIYDESLTYRPDLKLNRVIEAIKVNKRYSKFYLNYYNFRLIINSYIVPIVKKIIKIKK